MIGGDEPGHGDGTEIEHPGTPGPGADAPDHEGDGPDHEVDEPKTPGVEEPDTPDVDEPAPPRGPRAARAGGGGTPPARSGRARAG